MGLRFVGPHLALKKGVLKNIIKVLCTARYLILMQFPSARYTGLGVFTDVNSKKFQGLRPLTVLGGLTAPPQTPQLKIRPLRGRNETASRFRR